MAVAVLPNRKDKSQVFVIFTLAGIVENAARHPYEVLSVSRIAGEDALGGNVLSACGGRIAHEAGLMLKSWSATVCIHFVEIADQDRPEIVGFLGPNDGSA